MKTENKIIKALIERKTDFTIRELSELVGADYKIVHTAVKRLINKGIVNEKKVGRAIQITFNNKLSKEVLEVEFERREEALKNKNLKLILNSLKNNLKTVNLIILLFGSYAKGNANKNSDIDLIFIVPDEKIENKIEQEISVFPKKIHYLIFTERQFRNMKDSKGLNVVKEAMENNILLCGIEQYYELIK